VIVKSEDSACVRVVGAEKQAEDQIRNQNSSRVPSGTGDPGPADVVRLRHRC
jgi:hypothetical protein